MLSEISINLSLTRWRNHFLRRNWHWLFDRLTIIVSVNEKVLDFVKPLMYCAVNLTKPISHRELP
jgi:hypothetical protein